jgi:hypothetical protein
MASNLDKLAGIVSPTARTTRAFSATLPIPLMDELDRLSEELQLPRSTVIQGLLFDSLVARYTQPFRSLLNCRKNLEEHEIDPDDCELDANLIPLFDPERYQTEGMTWQDAFDAAEKEIAIIEKRWSI